MKIQTIVDKYYGENCYIVWNEKSGKCAVIDPDTKDVAEEVKALSLTPEFILLTHGHFDHIGGVDDFLKEYNIPVYIHEEDAELLTDGYKNASTLFNGSAVITNVTPQTLVNGDEIALGELSFKVVHTPGHTKGSVCYFCGHAVFTGDTLFARDRGRTDLYGGNEQTIAHSIQKLTPLLCDKTIYPGHGPTEDF